MNNNKVLHKPDPFVIVEVAGGNIQNITNPYHVPVRIVNWDELNAQGIHCPVCDSTIIAAAGTAKEARFICGNEHEFIWQDAQAVAV